jgi:ribonuclease P protein component
MPDKLQTLPGGRQGYNFIRPWRMRGMTLKRFSFPKRKRLVSNKEFKSVMARKLRFSNGILTLYMAENNCGYPRLGVSVGKSCGKAVVRNRLKRLLREVFRQNQDRIPSGFDYLLMPSPALLAAATRPAASWRSQERGGSRSAKLKEGRTEVGRESKSAKNRPQNGTPRGVSHCGMKFAQFEASFLALVSAAGKVIK